jgi:hypothetical protein
MTINQLLGGLVIYHLVGARLRYRGVWWFSFVLLLVSGVATYYVVSRLLIVWPFRLVRVLIND